MAKGGTRYGAGRPGWRLKAEHVQRIDVRRWHRAGTLRAGYAGTWAWHVGDEPAGSIGYSAQEGGVTLQYSCDGNATTQRIVLDRTRCHFGGSRSWFVCPRCSARVAVLYLRGGRFACRRCQRVSYASQSEDHCARTWRKQARLEARLGKHWRRPKGMHRATHERLLDVIMACEDARYASLAGHLQQMG